MFSLRRFNVLGLRGKLLPRTAGPVLHRSRLATKAETYKMATLPDKINFAAEEEKILELWKRLDAFKRSLELTKDKPEVCLSASWSAGLVKPYTNAYRVCSIAVYLLRRTTFCNWASSLWPHSCWLVLRLCNLLHVCLVYSGWHRYHDSFVTLFS